MNVHDGPSPTSSDPDEIYDAEDFLTHGELIAMVARLHRIGDHVLDMTYGRGGFWRSWRPDHLVTNDLYTDADHAHDATDLPLEWTDRFDAAVFDPCHRFTHSEDQAAWDERTRLITRGTMEAIRVTRPGGTILVKCQTEMYGDRKRWMTDDVTRTAESAGARKVNERLMLKDAELLPPIADWASVLWNHSTLLVFEKPG